MAVWTVRGTLAFRSIAKRGEKMARGFGIVSALGLVVGLSSCSSGGGNGAGVDGGTGGNASPTQSPTGPKCGATATELVDLHSLATKIDAPFIAAPSLTVDATSVYFVFDNTLMRVPIRGGSVTTMFPLNTDPHLDLGSVRVIVTPTGAILHVIDGTANEQIVRVPIQGGAATTLASSNGTIGAFGTDQQDVYFVDQGGTKAVPADGGSVRLITAQVTAAEQTGGFGGSLAVVGTNLIVTTGEQGGAVVTVPIRGGPPTTLATAQPNASFPMSCGSATCWWMGATPAGVAGSQGPGAIARLDSNGNVTTLAQAPYFPWSLVFDGTDFFETVGCDVCDGSLLRIPAAGGPPAALGSGTYAAVDESCLYWSTSAGIFSKKK
jgi:hypothetical protein